MINEFKKQERKYYELKNKNLCLLILGIIFLIVGLVFLPIAFVTYKRVTTFDYDSFEAIIFYVCTLVGLALIILGSIFSIKFKKLELKYKELDKNEHSK